MSGKLQSQDSSWGPQGTATLLTTEPRSLCLAMLGACGSCGHKRLCLECPKQSLQVKGQTTVAAGPPGAHSQSPRLPFYGSKGCSIPEPQLLPCADQCPAQDMPGSTGPQP